MPYTHFRYIAYQVPTCAKDKDGNTIFEISPQNKNLKKAAVPDLKGDVKKLGEDAKARVTRFLAVLKHAHAEVQKIKGDNKNTLKIFMAPEFYFRPTGKSQTTGEPAYSYEEYKAIKDVLRKTISEGDTFNNWLVVPGTIIWKWTGSTQKRPNPSQLKAYFNTSLYIKGSTGSSTEKASKVLEKAWASPVDGLPTGRHGTTHTATADKGTSSELYVKYYGQDKLRKHVFSYGGVRLGLEICLEHLLHRLFSNDANNGGLLTATLPFPGYTDIHLQLLTAGGMPIDKKAIAARLNGYIMRSDGMGSKLQTNLCKVTGIIAGNTPAALDPNPDPATNTKCFSDDSRNVERTYAISGESSLAILRPPKYGDKYWFPQKIKVYKRHRV
ncbi:MAG: hypothetical protein KAW12_00550 [Candidatus Aminicenantes bacterium]|nr:hypothetical protein [Candidatus Aminicenantes bacterium]